jgi:Tol biopolymer transport system component
MSASIRGAVVGAAAVMIAAVAGLAQTAGARWDPTLVRGQTRTIDFAVDEGTIEAADLSPDGAWVVFDLLGHVYRVPAAGGAAECLTQESGAALNYHPRYSPDGRSIAFVSDRGGQDNLWLMDADGGHPRPVFLDLGSRVRQPAWLADGSGIVAVRVFPSLLNWELHRTTIARFSLRGGPPKELLFSDQAQYYWPAPSADGRHLYFYRSSLLRDLDGVTQGQRLGRLDLTTGHVVDLTPSSPPALYRADPLVEFAPEISPDGTTLAFARRIPGGSIEIRGRRYGVRTALWLRDLATGAERIAMDPIEPDATQGNAVRHMKVIPGYRWAADGRSIVIPEGGQLRRVWIDSGRIETIRFSARVRRELSATARSTFRVAEDSLRSRFHRWPATSPDGRRVVVEAVGRLWLADRASGRARPVTDPALGFAATPAWSPDGRWIAYATWDERAGGRLWKLPAEGGEPVGLVAEPGQYLHPTWTADGRSVIAVRGGFGGTRTDHTWWDLVRVPAASGPAVRIGAVPEPVRPSLVGTAVVVPVREPSGDLGVPARRREYPENRWRLTSIGPAGRATSPGVVPGEAAAVSPNGRWVAFVNRLDLYLAPMALVRANATPLRSAPGVRRLTRRGGLYPRWIGPEVLEYQSGDRHYRYQVGSGQLDSARLDVVVPRPGVGGTVALTGARILTMANRRVIERGTVVVRGSRIGCVGECSTAGVSSMSMPIISAVPR